MRGRRSLVALCALAFLAAGSPAGGGVRDDTDVLQAKLDAGGAVFLPKLPGGQCYATRGLWISRDDTTISSDGACIVALGFGPARLDPTAPKPHFANAVFSVNHSDVRAPVPARITISGLHITVPKAKRMHGIAVVGHEVTLSNLTIDGAPLNDVLLGFGVIGSGGPTVRMSLTGSTLRGAQRDGVLAYGPVGLHVEGNTVTGARGSGVHIRAADRGQPVLDTHVVGNTITANRGHAVFLDLAPANGPVLLAKDIDISGNRLSRNRGGGVVKHVTRSRAVRTPARSVAPPTTGDDTAWLQSRLDRGGGTIFLPKLPGGACYATRGLWVSHDHTTITSDGACIVALGLGPIRLHSTDGDPIASDAVFFVNRSGPRQPAPVDVTISNLRIVVPQGLTMYGVAVFGHRVTLGHLDIGGAPKDDVTISGRANGNSYAGDISVLDSTLDGAARNAISVTGAIGLHIERNTIEGVRDTPPGQPAAGIDVEPDTRDRPASDLHIVGNTIQDNAGPGILLELEPNEGPAVLASGLEINNNTIVRNALKRSPPKRAGIVLAGGQDGGAGTLLLKDNVIRSNGGPGILETHFRLVVDASGNDIGGNED
ncbi:MAG: right-handed parallel beta-helix repeat-containing protein [Gaiellaceae bacterium]